MELEPLIDKNDFHAKDRKRPRQLDSLWENKDGKRPRQMEIRIES